MKNEYSFTSEVETSVKREYENNFEILKNKFITYFDFPKNLKTIEQLLVYIIDVFYTDIVKNNNIKNFNIIFYRKYQISLIENLKKISNPYSFLVKSLNISSYIYNKKNFLLSFKSISLFIKNEIIIGKIFEVNNPKLYSIYIKIYFLYFSNAYKCKNTKHINMFFFKYSDLLSCSLDKLSLDKHYLFNNTKKYFYLFFDQFTQEFIEKINKKLGNCFDDYNFKLNYILDNTKFEINNFQKYNKKEQEIIVNNLIQNFPDYIDDLYLLKKYFNQTEESHILLQLFEKTNTKDSIEKLIAKLKSLSLIKNQHFLQSIILYFSIIYDIQSFPNIENSIKNIDTHSLNKLISYFSQNDKEKNIIKLKSKIIGYFNINKETFNIFYFYSYIILITYIGLEKSYSEKIFLFSENFLSFFEHIENKTKINNDYFLFNKKPSDLFFFKLYKELKLFVDSHRDTKNLIYIIKNTNYQANEKEIFEYKNYIYLNNIEIENRNFEKFNIKDTIRENYSGAHKFQISCLNNGKYFDFLQNVYYDGYNALLEEESFHNILNSIFKIDTQIISISLNEKYFHIYVCNYDTNKNKTIYESQKIQFDCKYLAKFLEIIDKLCLHMKNLKDGKDDCNFDFDDWNSERNKINNMMQKMYKKIKNIIRSYDIETFRNKNTAKYLILQEEINSLPIEHLFGICNVSRIPSLLYIYIIHKKQKDLIFSSIDSLFYNLDPGDNLKNSYDLFNRYFTENQNFFKNFNIEKISKRFLTKDEFYSILSNKKLFLFIGHGSHPIFRMEKKQTYEIKSLVLSMGCESSKILYKYKFCSYGNILNYLSIGVSYYIGTLWPITDKEIDSITVKFLELLKNQSNSFDIQDLFIQATKEAKYKYLSTQNFVFYGIKTYDKCKNK